MGIRICVAGATGWTGSAVVRGILETDDLELVGAVSRGAAGTSVAEALGGTPACDVGIAADVRDALETPTDVLIDYTHPSAVRENVMAAITAGTCAVIGTSGLAAPDFAEIGRVARERRVGVVASGNFSITAALLKHFAGIAARHVPHWEVIDYASAGKPDAPSGTAQELAEFLGERATNDYARPVEDTLGTPETRGATIGGAQVHSLRLPSYVISVESIFGLPDERLTIRHDAGSSAAPYVGGTLLAARAAPGLLGLTRGLDTLLFGGET
ncbi:MAG: 4-hydroxy-tetrahydrodipicolinate reductase [Gemmatimonadetes bacterium]|nr:4-hydroxy-tetrahydrodipicolinate reductase [Gemmatimonadota bacterium]